jgi:DNA-binding NtrC family response regulator
MTAYAAHDLLAEAEREGVLRVLPKPVNLGSLLSLISAQLNRRHSVLIVDHDATFLKTLSEVLILRGIDAVAAPNLKRATQLILERNPAAVLLHMHLDATNAREAAGVVHRVSPETALILYSGMPGAADELERIIPTEWIHAYLQKPFAVEQLTRMLDGINDEV